MLSRQPGRRDAKPQPPSIPCWRRSNAFSSSWAGRIAGSSRCASSAAPFRTETGNCHGRNMTGSLPLPMPGGRSGWRCWRLSALRASTSARSAASPWRRHIRPGRMASLKGKIRTTLLPPGPVPETAGLCPEKQYRLRRDLSHQRRQGLDPPADLGGEEDTVRCGGSGKDKGLSPQPAPSLRPNLLPRR